MRKASAPVSLLGISRKVEEEDFRKPESAIADFKIGEAAFSQLSNEMSQKQQNQVGDINLKK